MQNALVPSAKRIFTTLRLLARMSAADAAIQKKKKKIMDQELRHY